MNSPADARSPERTNQLIAAAQKGDMAAADLLVRENMNLVYALVQRFLYRGCDKEELVQVGLMGFVKAINNFDVSSGNRLSTYAVPLIIGEIKRFLRDDQPVHVSRNYREAGYKVWLEHNKFLQEHQREPGLKELAVRLGMPAAEVQAVLEANRRPVSLQQPTDRDGSANAAELGELICGEEGEDDWVNGLLLRETLDRLPPRLQYVMECRYFKEWTQEKIAANLGVSQVQVSRLEKQALGLLREYLAAE